MRHMINKLTVELACGDEQQAFKTREAFLRDIYDEMVSVMEMCCDRLSDDDHLTQIEKLEINLKAFKNNFLDKKQYTTSFEAAFSEALEKKIASAAKMQTPDSSNLNTLFWFLETGYLPWWADEGTADIALWCDEVIQGNGLQTFNSWLLTNRHLPVIWKRISRQLPASFGGFVISHIPVLAAMREKLESWFEIKADNRMKGSVATQNTDLRVQHALLEHAVDLLDENTGTEVLFARLVLEIAPEAETGSPPRHQDVGIQERLGATGPELTTNEDKDKAETNTAMPFAGKEVKIVTPHAGIILLTAFLRTFFTHLKLWGNDQWQSDESRYQAVYLLHYLATGATSAFEYQLTLEKIVCGVPLDEPIRNDIMLSVEQLREADELLVSVVQHWKALKNTSVEGLRLAFIQRQGLINRKSEDWQLKVERKTLDVLLEQLPWGYATVSLPWNKYLIYTEW